MPREIRVDLTEDKAFGPRAGDKQYGVMFSLSGSWDDDQEILRDAAKAVASALNDRGRYQEADNLLAAIKRTEPDLGRAQRTGLDVEAESEAETETTKKTTHKK